VGEDCSCFWSTKDQSMKDKAAWFSENLEIDRLEIDMLLDSSSVLFIPNHSKLIVRPQSRDQRNAHRFY
jgi:hypothetical protein